MSCERVAAAMRRRERRLRLWAKHERLTVAMALAENLHHSRQKVEGGKHEGPPAQKTARATGARPGVLEEPEPQGGAVTDGYVAAPLPSLAVPLLAGAAGEGVDSSSLRFLTAAALRQRKEEERKREQEKVRERKKEQEKELALLEKALLSRELAGKRRKRKKRRKRRTPRTSSRSLRGRARRRQRQWHARKAGFPGYVPLLAVFPLRCSASLPVWTRRTVARSSSIPAVQGSYCWFYCWLCVPFGCRQARGQVGMDQKNNYAVCGFYWRRCSSRCVPVLCRQVQDAWHHGQFDSEGQLPRGVLEKCVFLGDDVIFFRIQLFGSTVDTYLCQSTEAWSVVPTAENCGKSAVAVHRWSSIFLSWCTGRFPWSCCSADHGVSTVAVLARGDRCPWYGGRAGTSLCSTTGALHSCSSSTRSSSSISWRRG